MQRIPGVTLSRGDGGEGRNISVRGLGPGFTRVRINGMEGAAQTGSSDIYGAGNNGRSFDFNVFPTEIFSQLAVRKTPSADVEEGSLGATVDLKAPRPFDYADGHGFLAHRPRRVQLGEPKTWIRAPRCCSQEVLRQHVRRAGLGRLPETQHPRSGLLGGRHSALRTPTPTTSAPPPAPDPCCRTARRSAGPRPRPSPAIAGTRGATATNCSTGNPRTSTWRRSRRSTT